MADAFFDSREEVLSLTKRLVGINSIVNTEGEVVIAHSLYTLLSSYPYFMENPDNLVIEQTVNDEYERYNVLAFVKGTKRPSNRTVILMGHTDTVGVGDFNKLHEYAFSPDDWMEILKEEDIPETARDQLDSGDWLFGRGALDMKSGLASHLYLLRYYAENPHQLAGNLVLVAECDEEDSSNGILSALKTLKQWKKQHRFDYVAAINADFVAPRYEGDPNRYIYKGTVGKLLPSFFVTGAETHVGAAFEGLDPNFVVSELTKQLSYNPALCNEAYGEVTMPPVSLKQIDLKPAYDVQTALSAYAYYNFFIHSWSPKYVLNLLKEQAEIAFKRALTIFEERYKQFCHVSGQKVQEITWNPRVFTYEEMNQMLTNAHGVAYTNHMEMFKKELLNDDTLDIRMYAARVVEEAWKWMEDKNPTIIVFYSSLYSPRIELTGKTKQEKIVIEGLEKAVEEIQPNYQYPIVTKNFYPYISDMSFMALSDSDQDLAPVADNNPSWGSKFYVNYQDIRDINVPVINIGPYGIDAHKKLERMEMTYSLEIVPNLTNRVIQHVLNH
ncbi:Arginine utilization protein RocB [Oceanobacillus limi]|uniref:Arginine utilization protein RocB n=1 Tax=Oceanobacillus limi TaxID=930131 RepID=A0A1I0BVR2_9BACI|nr:M20/M25/M40 family metallo-hydrolase [Oceanobacillus limi]SET11204.1 Arginine utilization protein RocB [Oceanobacillus limi]